MGYTTNPGYGDLVYDLYTAMKFYYRPELWQNYTFPQSFFDDFRRYYHFEHDDYFVIIYIAIIITILRYLFEMYICEPIVAKLNIDDKSSREKLPESVWKCLIYSVLWFYCAWLIVFSGRYDYFTRTWGVWEDWEVGMSIPTDIRYLYFVECGFYLHSVYATIYMDAKRKDTGVMLLHHVLTMILITVSYATRYHKIGLLVLFVHDVTDILLEFTKINVYLKNRNKKFYALHDHVSTIGFATFSFAWLLFRLYWFPLKVLYSTGVVSVHTAYYKGAGLYAFFNVLLLILLALDIYWFYFIALFLYKVLTGQLEGINDTREYEVEEIEKKLKEATTISETKKTT